MARGQRYDESKQLVPEDYFRRLERDEIFADSAPLEIDLGCGEGAFLLAMAQRFPDRRFLGVERLLGRVHKVCRRAEQLGLANLRVLRLESAYAIDYLLPLASVSRLHLLFPDPWPKKRHHDRRVVKTDFLAPLHRLLTPQGEFLFKTDHPEYFEEAAECVNASPHFDSLGWDDDDFPYPQTDFERLWTSKGKEIHRARWRKAQTTQTR